MVTGVYVLNERYEFELVNEAYAEMVGSEPAELLGEHVSITVTDETVEAVLGIRGELEPGE